MRRIRLSISSRSGARVERRPSNPPVAATDHESLSEKSIWREGAALARVSARANRQCGLHDGGVLKIALFQRQTRGAAPSDPGLQQISEWRTWFVTAHAQRLRDNGVDEDTFTREHATIVALADAITGRMRSDYLARTR